MKILLACDRQKAKRLLHFALSIVLMFLYACGSEPETTSETGTIAFSVTFEGAPTEEVVRHAAQLDCADAGVDEVEGKVYDENDEYLASDAWDCEDHQGTISGVPAGSNRKVVILGKDSSGDIRYRGEVTGITVVAGQENDTGTITAEFCIPEPNSPLNGSLISSSTLFGWSTVTNASEYYLQIATDSSFASLVLDDTTTENYYAPSSFLSDNFYYWRVRAIDRYGNESAWSEVWSFTVSTGTVPSAPTNVTAAPGDSEVTIGWDSVSEASSYSIYWSTSTGVSKVTYDGRIQSITQTTYTHTGCTNGTTYYYVVTASNFYGESVESEQVDATPDWGVRLFGTSSADYGHGIAFDLSGNSYVTGYTYGDLDDELNNGNNDIFISKYDGTGTWQWTKLLGTALDDYGHGIAVDSNGNSYITGSTLGDLDGQSNAGSYDIFISKYNTSGTKQWTKLLGTTSDDQGWSIAVDLNGNSYVTGYTDGDLDGQSNAGSYDIFISKYNTSGTKQWTKLLGSSSSDVAYGIAIDLSDNTYITGATYGDLDGETNAGSWDIFVTKYNSAGTKQWTRLLGTSSTEYGYSIAVDSNGNSYVTGYTYGDLDGQSNAGSSDIFISKYNTSGTKQWTKLLGTSAVEIGFGIGVDSNGNSYIVGRTGGDLDSKVNQGDYDIFATKYDTTGTKQWTRLLGTSADDHGMGISVNSKDSSLITGYTYGDLDGNINAGDYDIFIWKVRARLISSGWYDTAGSAQGVHISGNYAYVADESNGLQVINLTDPENPTFEGSYDTLGTSQGIYVIGDYAYVADDTNGLQIIDISNPTNPTWTGEYIISGSAYDVFVSGSYAYVAYGTDSGLQILDISDPTNPTWVGEFDTDGSARGVFVSGNYAYVADYDNGLQVIDISDPTNPTWAGDYITTGSAYDVFVSGSYAYVAYGTIGGLQILDIITPTNPTLVGDFDTDGSARGVFVSGNYAYVADYGRGLQVINIFDPTDPIWVEGYITTGHAYDVYISESYAYVAYGSDSGLQVLSIQ